MMIQTDTNIAYDSVRAADASWLYWILFVLLCSVGYCLDCEIILTTYRGSVWISSESVEPAGFQCWTAPQLHSNDMISNHNIQ